ncbi:F-box protein At2g17036-like [Tripterygium wilfordii]|uniref:F-box protein At2g17036-like n=1 Tax=Tripterygium wilfordii TaxID=458696 RepID=UPI0018F807AA|nr:F-box protein At2g17036-like [Tripterygium wilfordii]
MFLFLAFQRQQLLIRRHCRSNRVFLRWFMLGLAVIDAIVQLELCFWELFVSSNSFVSLCLNASLTSESPKISFWKNKLVMELSESDWAWLSEGILDGILDSIVSFYDYARFSAVCKHWYSVARHRRRQLMELWSVQLPLLMFPSAEGRENQQSLYNVITGKTHDFKLNYNRRCCGYSHGWLATLGKDMLITLRNPFLNQIITLPPIFLKVNLSDDDPYSNEYRIYKVVMSHNPYLYPDKYEVVAIYDGCLAILKPGSQSWAYLDNEHTLFTCSVDIIYYEDMLLVINDYELMSINANGSRPQMERIAWNDNEYGHLPGMRTNYLVKSSGGDLLYICRYIDWDNAMTLTFKIFTPTNKAKINKLYWREIKSLGDDALFLGDSHSLCVKASNFPGCKPNTMYFAPHSWDISCYRGLHDMGVFNLENGSITPYYHCDQSQRYFPPPFWVVPTLGDNIHVQLTTPLAIGDE